MYRGISSRIRSFSLIGVLALALGGCQSEQSSGDTSEDGAPRANENTAPYTTLDAAPARPVISQMMPYTEIGDELVYGYFSAPADMFEPLPAVIMIHEWWGLNDSIRSAADRLAGEGYIVLAVDLFSGGVASSPADARLLMLQVVEDPEAANDNLRAAYQFVTEVVGAPRVGSLGWSFGGAWSLNTARLFPEALDASVIYYGQVTDDEDILRPINAPILGLFAAQDTNIKVASVEAFRAALLRLRKNYEVHIYPDAGSAFANPTGNNYDPANAEDAWRRTLEFLNHHLSIDESATEPSG
jgi:carboxymethylenebutenolidase